MHVPLPTCKFNSWSVTSLRDSLISELTKDKECNSLSMFFYAITALGWKEIQKPVMKWMKGGKNRSATIYVGTDHAITDPNALVLMDQAGVKVCLMQTYSGVFHPKVVWLQGENKHLVWVGSNNLTKDGLLNNIEFAVLVSSEEVPADMTRWASTVATGSSILNEKLLNSYRKERDKFEKKRADARAVTFTWSRKAEPVKPSDGAIRKGDLVLEIMEKETRGGNQIQVPKKATKAFFGLEHVGEQKEIKLRRKDEDETRQLVMTVFKNNTVRLSVNELEYRDRPCVIIFHKEKDGTVLFEIVPESIFPSRYRSLIAMCSKQTREGSRRWIIK